MNFKSAFYKTVITTAIIAAFTSGYALNHLFSSGVLPYPNKLLQDRLFSQTPRYMSYFQLFEGLNHKVDVAFVGDSITNFGFWHEAFPEVKVANRGISGDTSEGILKRIDQVIDLQPKVVYLMLGINDITDGRKVVDIVHRYQEIISKLQDHGIKVIVQSTLYTSRPDWNQKVTELNSQLVTYTQSRHITYYDMNKILAPTGTLESDATEDGIHLRAEMYLLWFAFIEQQGDF